MNKIIFIEFWLIKSLFLINIYNILIKKVIFFRHALVYQFFNALNSYFLLKITFLFIFIQVF